MNTFDTNLILGRPLQDLSSITRGQQLIAEMDKHHVEYGLVTHLAGAQQNARIGNQELFEQTRGLAHRLIPVPIVDLGNLPGNDDWRKWRDNGVHGVRICPEIHGRGDAHAKKNLLEMLESLGWFLQIPLQLYYKSGPLSGSLKDVAKFAALNETIKIIVCGINRELFADLRSLLRSTKNVYLDVGNLCRATFITQLVNAGFKKRLVCGSGFGISYLTPNRDSVLYAPIPVAAKQRILYANALELIKGR